MKRLCAMVRSKFWQVMGCIASVCTIVMFIGELVKAVV